MELVEVSVSGIALDQERRHPVVLLKAEDEDEILPIWIGTAEATAIFAALAGKAFERPMTHDLLAIVVEVLGSAVERIEITGLHSDTYFARIVLKRGEDVFYVDARPSDSIALALRTDSAIFIDRELFNTYKRSIDLGPDDDVRKRLKELDPGNFGDFDA
ncbi:MAG: bifunctional nuclease family protein [Candidatus Krumholzibacteria bacterium]|nr:bifunctional nuclease family protein [Candidatus Krumholzibacteria bacterium]